MAIYFPILNDTKLYNGSTIVYNFPPNNINNVRKQKRYLSLIWLEKNKWNNIFIQELNPYESIEIFYKSYLKQLPNNNFCILCLSNKKLNTKLNKLPENTLPDTFPTWRATVCAEKNNVKASYQGEIMPFPPKTTLISFSPFHQSGSALNNYLLFLNLESLPISRECSLKVSNLDRPKTILKEIKVKSNNCNLINLNNIKSDKDQILIIYSKDISGIPIYLSFSDKEKSLSLEHSHPPGSLFILGSRKESQKILKKNWFDNFLQ